MAPKIAQYRKETPQYQQFTINNSVNNSHLSIGMFSFLLDKRIRRNCLWEHFSRGVVFLKFGYALYPSIRILSLLAQMVDLLLSHADQGIRTAVQLVLFKVSNPVFDVKFLTIIFAVKSFCHVISTCAILQSCIKS